MGWRLSQLPRRRCIDQTRKVASSDRANCRGPRGYSETGGGRFSTAGIQQSSGQKARGSGCVRKIAFASKARIDASTTPAGITPGGTIDSGAVQVSCSFTPSAKAGVCARSSLMEITGSRRTRMQARITSPRANGTVSSVLRRRQCVQARNAATENANQARLRTSSIGTKYNTKRKQPQFVP